MQELLDPEYLNIEPKIIVIAFLIIFLFKNILSILVELSKFELELIVTPIKQRQERALKSEILAFLYLYFTFSFIPPNSIPFKLYPVIAIMSILVIFIAINRFLVRYLRVKQIWNLDNKLKDKIINVFSMYISFSTVIIFLIFNTIGGSILINTYNEITDSTLMTTVASVLIDILGKWDMEVLTNDNGILIFAFSMHAIMILIGYIQFRALLNGFKKSNNQIHSDLKITVDAINCVEIYRSCKFSNYDDKYFCFSYENMEIIYEEYDKATLTEKDSCKIKKKKTLGKGTEMLKMGKLKFLKTLIADIFVVLLDSKKNANNNKEESEKLLLEIMIATDKVVKIEVE